jgi:hypothetical protein
MKLLGEDLDNLTKALNDNPVNYLDQMMNIGVIDGSPSSYR